MTKLEIIKEVAKSTGVEQTIVSSILESSMETIRITVSNGEPVYLRGFGTFDMVHREAKPARNITAKTTITIPARDVPHFKPCKSFKDAMK